MTTEAIMKRNKPEDFWFFTLARNGTFVIVFMLAYLELGRSTELILPLLCGLIVIIGIGIIKEKYESKWLPFFGLNLLYMTLVLIFSLSTRYPLHTILYFVGLIEYFIAWEFLGLPWILGLFYGYNLIFLLYCKVPTDIYFSHFLTITSLCIFALVMAKMVSVQRREKETIEKLQVQIVQQEKMASLGQLTAGVAHEINTPLGAIQSNTETSSMLLNRLTEVIDLLPDSDEKAKSKQLVEKLHKSNETNLLASKRIIEIVKKLRTFSRLDEAVWQEGDLHEGIESVLALLEHEFSKRIKLVKNYGNIPPIYSMSNLVNQVVMNILINAVQAMEDEGEIHISTWAEEEYVWLSVRDTGKGISREHLPRIFDPGFTTKGVGIGTGLGLSICYDIVQRHEGEIYCKSEEGQGAEFIVKLPIRMIFKKGVV